MTSDRRGWGSRPSARDQRRRTGRDDRAPTRVGEILEDFLEETGVGSELERISAIEEWPELVGEKIAAVTRARSVSDGTLIVEVRSSAWLMELNMMKGEILSRVNRDREVSLEKLVFVLSPEG